MNGRVLIDAEPGNEPAAAMTPVLVGLDLDERGMPHVLVTTNESRIKVPAIQARAIGLAIVAVAEGLLVGMGVVDDDDESEREMMARAQAKRSPRVL
jgi:hypothetical protein